MKINKNEALANAAYQVYQGLEPTFCSGFSKAAFIYNFNSLTLVGHGSCGGNSYEYTSVYAEMFFHTEILEPTHEVQHELKTLIYSRMFKASSATSIHVLTELNHACFSTSQPHLWDIQNELPLQP